MPEFSSTTESRDVEVIIVGAGPTGLMLAAELCLAGVRPLVLERRPDMPETLRANGFGLTVVCWSEPKRPASVPSTHLLGYRSATCMSTCRH
jgi:ribulose 1,5-bisphosphate synthetase/thiazole synthase